MSASAPPAPSSQQLGLQSRQALGCAWKRRSAGLRGSREAGRAHGKHRHARGCAVVGIRADNRQLLGPERAELGEGIAIAAVGRLADIREAGEAGCGVPW